MQNHNVNNTTDPPENENMYTLKALHMYIVRKRKKKFK